MSLQANLAVASSGLANINRQLGVVSQNVANVGTPGYTRQVLPQTAMSADGVGMGVRSGVAQRQIDQHLQRAALQQASVVAGLEVHGDALAAIDAVHGATGAGDDLAGLVGRLSDSFTRLAADPASQPSQSAVVTAADDLARQVGRLHTAYAAGRQSAHDALVADIDLLNTTLSRIGTLSDTIVQLRVRGESTADLENQRDAARAELSQLVDVRAMESDTGDLLLATPSGLNLPTHSTTPPFALNAAALDATAFHPGGGVPAITMAGVDVTARFGEGRLGANIALRDAVIPNLQAQLDEFAFTLTHRFEDQGLRLFSDAAGAIPAGGGIPVQDGYVGYAGTITVNPAIAAQPSLVRDGTHDVAGGAGATAFTPNPAGGPSGFATLLGRVLDFALGEQIAPGIAQQAPARTGLGPTGTLSAPYAPPARLSALATALVSAQAGARGQTDAALSSAQSLQIALDDKVSSSSAVSVDQEMTTMLQLQHAYAANARVISTVQAMLDAMLGMVR